ncbi:glyoxylase-like metal-dependent hydrolase (beta-lactamase superfamily II) [Crenobacter luteus]|uniref:MBL fold metallo-hydrolase n=1 Tax=Crenobacter luteus TaxID=1452487 RepID=A0A165FH50_9NEIS|nr:MBL fold metallo-hydrolase [Crenobacter luteus]KZE33252.1 MBL fold metallo-hydrolase [Crenobacter luteus]TCP13662.1 glyoxylase-like metal-dependent hydrolase (beta-lactamase superfamily II) [Crenobacter luteus]
MPVQIDAFYDAVTGTVSYLVYDTPGGRAAIVDPVLDYDPKSGRTSHTGAQRIVARVRELGLTVDWLLETHAHADHLSAAAWLQRELGGRIAIGRQIDKVQRHFKPVFNLEAGFATDGTPFDVLLDDGDTLPLGQLSIEVMHLPGHTAADVAYRVDDAVFVGDTLFMPDVGTARCDFPGGDAATLYHSVQRLYALPPETRLFMCHDYPPAGRAPAWETTVAEQRARNIHLRDGVGEADFVAMRTARDATLAMPVLILPAIQVNIRAGHLPPPEANGRRYLKIPLDTL